MAKGLRQVRVYVKYDWTCEITKDVVLKFERGQILNGLFHCWGTEGDVDDGYCTFGIVELTDKEYQGYVIQPEPMQIRFIDQEVEENG